MVAEGNKGELEEEAAVVAVLSKKLRDGCHFYTKRRAKNASRGLGFARLGNGFIKHHSSERLTLGQRQAANVAPRTSKKP